MMKRTTEINTEMLKRKAHSLEREREISAKA
jgi:hypothetical protein